MFLLTHHRQQTTVYIDIFSDPSPATNGTYHPTVDGHLLHPTTSAQSGPKETTFGPNGNISNVVTTSKLFAQLEDERLTENSYEFPNAATNNNHHNNNHNHHFQQNGHVVNGDVSS